MTPGAERQRRYRRRQKAGHVVVPVTVPAHVADAFARERWLRDWQVDDRPALAAAIEQLLDAVTAEGAGGTVTHNALGFQGVLPSWRRER